MRFVYDSVEKCGACGQRFVYTAKRQRQRAANVKYGMSRKELPPFCDGACANRYVARERRKATP